MQSEIPKVKSKLIKCIIFSINCLFKSWAHDAKIIDLRNMSDVVKTENYVLNTEWELESIGFKSNLINKARIFVTYLYFRNRVETW